MAHRTVEPGSVAVFIYPGLLQLSLDYRERYGEASFARGGATMSAPLVSRSAIRRRLELLE